MSTIRKRNTGKIAMLLQQDRNIFHISDLMLLWNATNQASLRRTISRYVKKGILLKIYRGFYSVVPLSRIDPRELGSSALHSYCYVSTETVLAQNSIIFQQIDTVTFCASKTRQIRVDEYTVRSRQLKDEYLYNTAGVIEENRYRIASTERAIADMLYFNPHYHFDATDRIDWKKVAGIQKEVGYL